MLKEFMAGYQDAGNALDRFLAKPQTDQQSESVATKTITYRLSWLFYIAPDFRTAPERAPFFSVFHAQAHRIPSILSEILAPFGKSIVGVFPEPISATEDLGYVVFTDEVDAISVSARLSKAIEKNFAAGPQDTGYLYAEIELSACVGTLSAPAMIAKREILLNVGFDCVRRDRDVIETSGEYPS